MADVAVNPSASYTVAADDIAGVGYQRIKIDVGASGVTSGDVGATNPLPVAVSGAVQVSGTVTIAPTVLTVNTAVQTTVVSGTVTVNGSVAVVPGVSVVAQVSGTVTIAPTTFTVNTVQTSVSVATIPTILTIVTQLGTQMVSMAQTSVSVAVLPTVSTIITILGTQVVSVVPGLSVSAVVSGTVTVAGNSTTAVPSISAVGNVVWVAGGQSTTAFPVVITGTVTAGAGTTVVSGTVTIIPTDRTAATPAANASGQIVWVANPGAAVATTVLTVQTILGTAVVSVVPGVAVTIQSALSTIVTILGTQIVSVVPGLSVVQAAVSIATTGLVSGQTGQAIWPGTPAYTQIVLVCSSTLVAAAGSTLLFTVYQSVTQTVAGVAGWVVPAGKNFRLLSFAAGVRNSITTTPVIADWFVLVSTGAITFTSTVGVLARVAAYVGSTNTVANVLNDGIQADVPAGQTVALGKSFGTTGNIVSVVAHGYLF